MEPGRELCTLPGDMLHTYKSNWRAVKDSNLRSPAGDGGLATRCNRPLCQLPLNFGTAAGFEPDSFRCALRPTAGVPLNFAVWSGVQDLNL